MQKRELKNIGTVRANEIQLCDSFLGLYIPIETESDKVKEEREKFESYVLRDAKKAFPNIDFEKCKLYTEADLHINTGAGDGNGRYELCFSIGFVSWIEDEEGNEVYMDCCDGFEIEPPEEDKVYLKKTMAMKIVDALF